MSGTLVAKHIPAIVLSHGKNYIELDPSDFEAENLDYETTEPILFIQRDFSQKDGEEFDDLLIWISPHTLRLKMVEAGLLP
ncbi:MAG: hypothetical protein U5P41_00760 [Gammaproteobacteria bacterium]|nr:hypothetical protein [Gammaproteobacteria bacterium]